MRNAIAILPFVPAFLNAKENMVVNMMLSSRYSVKVSFVLNTSILQFSHSPFSPIYLQNTFIFSGVSVRDRLLVITK